MRTLRASSLGLALATGSLWATAAQAPGTAAPARAAVLGPGDLAPPLQVSRWLKGTPVPQFQQGQVYVVEFWATWCGGCVAAMPHVSELARHYAGKATFIGVDVWERPGSAKQTVDTFMKAKGATMDYNVCADTLDEAMGNGWLKASGTQWIPQSFIIDHKGRIAFIGAPSSLDKALELVVAGTYDPRLAAAAVDWEMVDLMEQITIAQATTKVSPAIEAALAAKDPQQVARLVDEAEAAYPILKDHPGFGRNLNFRALAPGAPERAKAVLEEGLTASSGADQYWNRVLTLKKVWNEDKRWADLALDYLSRMAAKDPLRAPTLAPTRFQALLRADEAPSKAAFEAARRTKDPALLDLALVATEDHGQGAFWDGEAIPILQEAVKTGHEPVRAGRNLAAACFRQGHFPEAVAAQRQVLERMRQDPHQAGAMAAAKQVLASYLAACK